MTKLITVGEAAAQRGVSSSTIYKLLERGRLTRHEYPSGKIAISQTELDAIYDAERLPEILENLVTRAAQLLPYDIRATLAAKLLPEDPPVAFLIPLEEYAPH